MKFHGKWPKKGSGWSFQSVIVEERREILPNPNVPLLRIQNREFPPYLRIWSERRYSFLQEHCVSTFKSWLLTEFRQWVFGLEIFNEILRQSDTSFQCEIDFIQFTWSSEHSHLKVLSNSISSNRLVLVYKIRHDKAGHIGAHGHTRIKDDGGCVVGICDFGLKLNER